MFHDSTSLRLRSKINFEQCFMILFFSLHSGPCIIDAVFRWSNGYLYFFSQGNYYRYNKNHFGIDKEYPIKIGDFWKGVPSDIDGVFRYINGITYFFKGDKYFRFNDAKQQVDPGYPKLISSYWKGVPNNIDAVIR